MLFRSGERGLRLADPGRGREVSSAEMPRSAAESVAGERGLRLADPDPGRGREVSFAAEASVAVLDEPPSAVVSGVELPEGLSAAAAPPPAKKVARPKATTTTAKKGDAGPKP